MKHRYITTAKCPDGSYYGAAWDRDHSLIAMSDALPTRGKARYWAAQFLN